MLINFTKMQGLGNDFVVIDAISQSVALATDQLRFIADRHFGIGCDQILLVEAPAQPGVDFRYRIYNADGGEVEQCGNGARCFARFVLDKHLTTKQEISVETSAGVISTRVEANGDVTVNMGVPCFIPVDIFRSLSMTAIFAACRSLIFPALTSKSSNSSIICSLVVPFRWRLMVSFVSTVLRFIRRSVKPSK